MRKTPEALRLAAWLTEGAFYKMKLGDVESAGRELRRLHAANHELLDALTLMADELNAELVSGGRSPFSDDVTLKVREVIAKAAGSEA